MCEAERCSADMRERPCVSAAAASDAPGSAVVSFQHRQGWAHTAEEVEVVERSECDPGCFETTSPIALWQGVEKCNISL